MFSNHHTNILGYKQAAILSQLLPPWTENQFIEWVAVVDVGRIISIIQTNLFGLKTVEAAATPRSDVPQSKGLVETVFRLTKIERTEVSAP